MKLECYCVVIFLCCFTTVLLDDNYGKECLEEHLKNKGKLESDFPVRRSTQNCSVLLSPALAALRIVVEDQIKQDIPTSADCLIKEFYNRESSDLIVKLFVIEDSKLSESEIKTKINETRKELRRDLVKVALRCETDEKNFIAIFNEILEKNLTLSKLEHNYCLAKYAADNELLQLNKAELNPDGIITTNLNCTAIINKSRRRWETHVSKEINVTEPESINCYMETYKNVNVFNTIITGKVLNYLDFSKETKEAELQKIADKFASFASIINYCIFLTRLDQ